MEIPRHIGIEVLHPAAMLATAIFMLGILFSLLSSAAELLERQPRLLITVREADQQHQTGGDSARDARRAVPIAYAHLGA
jgi:hypothetical protein